MRPRFTDAESAGIGFGLLAIAVTFCGVAARSYWNPGAALPTIGTEPWGLPRNAIVSAAVSHGSILGCCLKSVNHEQLARNVVASTTRPRAPRAARRALTLTSHLLGTVLLEHGHGVVGAIGIGHHPDAEVRAAEARVITDRHRQPRNVGEGEHREHRRQAADEYHHFESKNRERHPRRDRLAADDERPVIRDPHP